MPPDRRARLYRPATSSERDSAEPIGSSLSSSQVPQLVKEAAENVKVVMAIMANRRSIGCAVYEAQAHRLLLLQDALASIDYLPFTTEQAESSTSSEENTSKEASDERSSADCDLITSCMLQIMCLLVLLAPDWPAYLIRSRSD